MPHASGALAAAGALATAPVALRTGSRVPAAAAAGILHPLLLAPGTRFVRDSHVTKPSPRTSHSPQRSVYLSSLLGHALTTAMSRRTPGGARSARAKDERCSHRIVVEKGTRKSAAVPGLVPPPRACGCGRRRPSTGTGSSSGTTGATPPRSSARPAHFPPTPPLTARALPPSLRWRPGLIMNTMSRVE